MAILVKKPAIPALLCIFLLTACGGGGSAPSPGALPNALTNAAPTTSSVPSTTGAQQFTVMTGGQARDNAFQALDFFSENITIDEGDSVTWSSRTGEPHTVTFLGPRTAPPPPNDPSAPLPAGGSTYDGSTYTSSGFLLQGQSYTLTFPKAGTYAYLCILHQPVMTGVITVQPKGTPYPHPAGFYTGQGMSDLNAVLSAAKSSVRSFPFTDGGTHLTAGISPGLASSAPTNATVLRFLDSDTYTGNSTIVVPLNTTVMWTNESNNEPHTVTFAALGQPLPPNPFSPPTGPLTGQSYDGSALVNSGPFFPGQTFSVKFTKAGTYTYDCLFHDDTGMVGTVVVQ